MGWLWASSSPSGNSTRSEETSKDEQPSESFNFGLSERQRSRIFGQPNAPQDDGKSKETPPDKELESFLKSFSDPGTTQKTAAEEQQEKTTHERIRPDGTLDISPAALYPRTMSCRQAFDHAWYCQSPGGKFNDIYRYGRLQDCSDQWGAFWMCMRTRTLSTKLKQESIKDYYEARDTKKKKEFGSSEDVWEIRTVAVTRAFDRDADADDEEGRR